MHASYQKTMQFNAVPFKFYRKNVVLMNAPKYLRTLTYLNLGEVIRDCIKKNITNLSTLESLQWRRWLIQVVTF